jgi:hypothetical protein
MSSLAELMIVMAACRKETERKLPELKEVDGLQTDWVGVEWTIHWC